MDEFGVETYAVNPLEQVTNLLNEGNSDNKDLVITILISHIFMACSFFMLISTGHGNETIGQRFATFTFYPMKENETLLSSFLANTAFRNVVVTGVKQYAVIMFANWTRDSISY